MPLVSVNGKWLKQRVYSTRTILTIAMVLIRYLYIQRDMYVLLAEVYNDTLQQVGKDESRL